MMGKATSTILAVGSVMALSACGGGSSTPTIGGSPEYNALVADADRLATRLNDPTLTATPALPGGGATYQGVVILADSLGTTSTATSVSGVVGRADLTANFNSMTLTGTGTGFFQTSINTSTTVTGTGTPTAGSLDFTATAIQPIFTLGVDGTVTIDGTPRTISGTADGVFLGPNAEALAALGTDLPTTSSGFNVDIAIAAD